MEQKDILVEPGLFINKNVIQVGDSVIQVSNISKTQVGPVPKGKFPVWTIIVIILSLFILNKSIHSGSVVAFALITITLSAIVIYAYFDKANGYYLMIWLNSGNIICISSSNSNFLKQGQQVITNCFNGLFDKNNCFIVNFKDCTITESQFGEHNQVNF